MERFHVVLWFYKAIVPSAYGNWRLPIHALFASLTLFWIVYNLSCKSFDLYTWCIHNATMHALLLGIDVQLAQKAVKCPYNQLIVFYVWLSKKNTWITYYTNSIILLWVVAICTCIGRYLSSSWATYIVCRI